MNATKINASSFLLFAFTLIFFLDAIINKFTSIPLQLLSLPVFIFLILIFNKSHVLYLVLIFSFFFLVLGGRYTLDVNDIGYWLYLSFFMSSFIYLESRVSSHDFSNIAKKLIRTLFFISSVMFWSYLLGIDNQVHDADMSAVGANVEYYRQYHSGFFRAPHFSSYIFYFIGLATIYFKGCFKRCEFFLIISLCTLAVIMSGSRTPIYTFLFASIIVLIFRNYKYIIIALSLLFLTSIAYFYIDEILELSNGTVFYQYLSFFYTLKNDPDRLSRFQLFIAFYDGVKTFSVVEFLIGRSFSSQYDIVSQTVGQRLWFHNDYLSIFYSYGCVFLAFLLLYVFRLFYKYVVLSNSYIISIYSLSLVVFAMLNGIVYHPSYLILFIFFMMVSHDKKQSVNFKC